MENGSAPARAGRYALSQLARLCVLGGDKPRAQWLERAQIYHSPHTPFSSEIHKNRELKKFITCLDFIPLKNPEYYDSGIQHFMKGVLACLQPENFAFCISETTRADLLTYSKMPPERVFVTPLAADAAVFHPIRDVGKLTAVRRQYGLGDEPYFLALSAHDRHKNFPHLIECFGALVESGELTDCNLVIVGPNPGRNPGVQAAIERFPKAAGRIRVPGFVADEDLAAVYSGSLAFLFPSLAEGFGIPPLEAMHCGVPVIASNTTSIPEVVGDAGLLLPPSDKDAWCAAILRVARDVNLRAELSRRSPERAKLFSWQRFIDETIRGYKVSIERF
jgi:glycosyltransferase involved in cell wall biosynthesis